MTALLRYGVFDEFGFSGDQEYPNYFTVADRSFPSFKLSTLSWSTGMSNHHKPMIIWTIKTMIFVSQDLPNWDQQCNADGLLDPQVRKKLPIYGWRYTGSLVML